jgi:hypothetical protein
LHTDAANDVEKMLAKCPTLDKVWARAVEGITQEFLVVNVEGLATHLELPFVRVLVGLDEVNAFGKRFGNSSRHFVLIHIQMLYMNYVGKAYIHFL